MNKRRQESIVDLEMDFLAPYLQRFPDINSLTKAQAMEVKTSWIPDLQHVPSQGEVPYR